VLAIGLGLAARMSNAPTAQTRRRATLGIFLGGASVACFATFCFVYFIMLGYPLPHIARYRPEH
jgi:hypothetical protein